MARNPCIHPYIFGNIEIYALIPGPIPPVVKIYDKNVRNRMYRFISCQEKNPGWKILFFRGEILIWKSKLTLYRSCRSGGYPPIWSTHLPYLKICKITGKSSKFTILKSRFLHEKIIFFIQDFFPDKIWIYTFDCARFYHISVQPAGIFQEPVWIPLYFRKLSDFRKYWGIYTGSWNIPAGCKEIW